MSRTTRAPIAPIGWSIALHAVLAGLLFFGLTLPKRDPEPVLLPIDAVVVDDVVLEAVGQKRRQDERVEAERQERAAARAEEKRQEDEQLQKEQDDQRVAEQERLEAEQKARVETDAKRKAEQEAQAKAAADKKRAAQDARLRAEREAELRAPPCRRGNPGQRRVSESQGELRSARSRRMSSSAGSSRPASRRG